MRRVQPSTGGPPGRGRTVELAGGVESSAGGREVLDRRVEHADVRVAEVAAGQHGLVDRPQLLAAGLTRAAIAHRLRTGRLHPLHRGVYAVGHAAVTPLGRDLAAVMACGRGAVLSHRSAAVIWGLLPRLGGPPDVTTPGGRRVVRPGITVHRAEALPHDDIVRIEGIPVTAAERTVLDLAATGVVRDVERAVSEARVRGLVDDDRLLARSASRAGARLLRRLLTEEVALTRSEAERLLLALIRRAELPRPATNVRVGAWEVDVLWPSRRLVVEVDGYAFHSDRAAFERDRRKDADLLAAGYRVLRVTWRQLRHRPEATVARLAALLAG